VVFVVKGVIKAMSKELMNINTKAITRKISKGLYSEET